MRCSRRGRPEPVILWRAWMACVCVWTDEKIKMPIKLILSVGNYFVIIQFASKIAPLLDNVKTQSSHRWNRGIKITSQVCERNLLSQSIDVLSRSIYCRFMHDNKWNIIPKSVFLKKSSLHFKKMLYKCYKCLTIGRLLNVQISILVGSCRRLESNGTGDTVGTGSVYSTRRGRKAVCEEICWSHQQKKI